MGGVGTDLSDIRPNGSKVSNAALTSTGIVPFMERYSNTVREVGQSGRRGALMLSISCRHPESDAFISAKLEQGKVTGANISIKFDDEFMDCVINDKRYYQYFPIHEDINKIIPSEILNKVAEVDFDKVYSGMMEGSCFKVIKARKLWDKVIYNAWRSAEPGVMFFDEILRNTPTKPYFDKGFKPVSTNPCFTGDTLVMTEDFPEGIRIDELAKLGQVRFNVHSAIDYDCDGETVWYRELKQAIAFKTGTKEVIRLNLSNGTTVRCTPDHKFALNDGTYIEAKDSLGKLLVTYDVFTDVTVDSIESCNEVEDVYDLTVDYNHTFYIVCGKDAILVHNCGEIPLQPYDSCRLLHLNLYSFVDNPFTENASINWDKLSEMTHLATRMLDDIVDLELEKINKIIEKIKSDPESDEIKRTELNLWSKVRDTGINGRRIGLGTTADGDMLAALGIRYGTEEGNKCLESVHKFIAVNSYMESINLAVDRGAFEIFDYELEKDDYFVNKVLDGIKDVYGSEVYDEYINKWKTYGRRNTTTSTLAPVGSVSTVTQTTSGFEPVFSLFYQRKRKIEDKSKADFIDEVGDAFEINNVVHHKFVDWFIQYATKNSIMEFSSDPVEAYKEARAHLSNLPIDQLNELVSKSPYYKATANEIDPIMKVKLQGSIQNWIDNSISCTVNLPADTSVETVNSIYLEAYKAKCKGITIYRDGCRSGVLTSSSTPVKKDDQCSCSQGLPIRPDVLDAEVVRFKNGDESWIAYVGIKDGHPYEIFTGLEDKEEHVLPKSITKGKLIRVNDKKKKRYDFSYVDKYGYTNTIGGISHMFNKVYWNYARFISGYLRNNVPLVDTINVLEGLSFDKDSINTWKNGVIRALKKYVKDGTKSKSICPECGEHLVFENGCKICKNCGYSACN